MKTLHLNKLVYFGLILLFLFRFRQECPQGYSACAETIKEERYAEILNASSQKASSVDKFKERVVAMARADLPSPHSELLLGMTLGIDKFDELPIFSELLRNTGTIHVVVVSGYNVTLVYSFLITILGTMYSKRNFVIALAGTLLYAFISGFDPPVVRAWVMGSLLMLGKFYGLRLNMVLVMVFSALVLLCIDPRYLFSLSFKLSFVATLSLVLFDFGSSLANGTLATDLKATLAAQVLIWPVISYYFGQVSLISPLVNMLVLWTVPLATILGSVYVLLALLPLRFVSGILAWIVYFPLDVFTRIIELFSVFKWASVDYTMSLQMLILYYVIVLFLAVLRGRRRGLE